MNTHVKTDSVVFNWQPETVLPSVLALNRLADGVEIYTVAIEPGTNSFAIQKSKIGSGKFTWHLQGFVLKDTFEIANIK
jgi:hypothetical protein